MQGWKKPRTQRVRDEKRPQHSSWAQGSAGDRGLGTSDRGHPIALTSPPLRVPWKPPSSVTAQTSVPVSPLSQPCRDNGDTPRTGSPHRHGHPTLTCAPASRPRTRGSVAGRTSEQKPRSGSTAPAASWGCPDGDRKLPAAPRTALACRRAAGGLAEPCRAGCAAPASFPTVAFALAGAQPRPLPVPGSTQPFPGPRSARQPLGVPRGGSRGHRPRFGVKQAPVGRHSPEGSRWWRRWLFSNFNLRRCRLLCSFPNRTSCIFPAHFQGVWGFQVSPRCVLEEAG